MGRNGAGAAFLEEPPRWSRRWSEDPLVGMQVFLGGGRVEVYCGRDVWQTVAVSSA